MNKKKLGIKIALAVILIALVQGVFSFYRISILISTFGDEVNGVVQIALQISTFLVLFQSGMSASYQYKMYAPLANSEYERIGSLFSGLRKSMRKVSRKILIIAFVIIPIYSAILQNNGVRYWDTLLILAVIGIRITIPYFFTLPERVLIEIKEKKYIVIVVEGAKDILTICTEILLMMFTSLPLPLILCTNFIYLGLAKLVYLGIIRKYYGKSFDLKSVPEYASKVMTKAVYTHQAASVATGSTDSVVLSIFSTLDNVSIFSSFGFLSSYPSLVISRMIESLRASLALKITRNDEDSFEAFRELLAFSFLCVCVIAPVFLLMANPFVSLWISPDYNLPFVPLLLFTLLLSDRLIMPVIYAARDAKGLYQESKNYTIVQAVVNIMVSIGLVIPFGITGVLVGTFISKYLILQPCNIRLVSKEVFYRKLGIYKDFFVVLIICTVSFFAAKLIIQSMASPEGSWFVFVQKAVICTAIATLVAFVGLWLSNNGFRMLLRRFFRKSHTLPNNK